MVEQVSKTNIVQEIFSDLIDDPQHAMRSEIDRNELWELADNIKQNGLISPITVRPRGERFEVVAGHRRFSACKMNGLVRIPCVVRELSDADALAVMAAENLERQDIDPVDEANWLKQLIEVTGKSIEEVSRMIRRSSSYVVDRLEVASMPDYLQGHLKRGEIKLGVALALTQIDDEAKRRMWVDMAVRDGISVRMAEFWLTQHKMDTLPNATPSNTPPTMDEAAAYKPPMFTCALDGAQYHTQDMEVVILYRGNVPLFKELIAAYQNELAT